MVAHKATTTILLITAIMLLAFGCGRSRKPVFEKTALDQLIKERSALNNFSVILHDMTYDEPKEEYSHQYKIIYPPTNNPDTLLQEITNWKKVTPNFFNKHIDNMGMVIATKENGVLKKTPTPPGYNNYVGNERYGQWRTGSNGSSFWEFYGKYAFMSSIFGLMASPVRYGHWNDYRRNYYPSGTPYYGSDGGRPIYGTKGQANQSRTNTTWSNKPSTFKEKVRSNVKRSASSSSRGFFGSKTSRSDSRYGSSSSRSRSRGFGK